MFKVGQKVVFVFENCKEPNMNYPQHNSIVVIEALNGICPCGCGLPKYKLEGFPVCKLGVSQSFVQDCLRKIDYTFGEKLAEEIQEEINQEQLILK